MVATMIMWGLSLKIKTMVLENLRGWKDAKSPEKKNIFYLLLVEDWHQSSVTGTIKETYTNDIFVGDNFFYTTMNSIIFYPYNCSIVVS